MAGAGPGARPDGRRWSARRAARGARELWLGVWERNARAQAFYRKCGFRKVGTQIFVVGSDPQTDDVMLKEITVSARIEHVALWVRDLDARSGLLRALVRRPVGERYENPRKGFRITLPRVQRRRATRGHDAHRRLTRGRRRTAGSRARGHRGRQRGSGGCAGRALRGRGRGAHRWAAAHGRWLLRMRGVRSGRQSRGSRGGLSMRLLARITLLFLGCTAGVPVEAQTDQLPEVSPTVAPWVRWWWPASAVERTADHSPARDPGRGGNWRRRDHSHLRRTRLRKPRHRILVATLDRNARTHRARGRAPRHGRGYGHRHGLAVRRPGGERGPGLEFGTVRERPVARQSHRHEGEAPGTGGRRPLLE